MGQKTKSGLLSVGEVAKTSGRLPIALFAAIEFVGTIGIALWGLRTGCNYLAFVVAIVGVALLIDMPSLLAADGPALVLDLQGLFWGLLTACCSCCLSSYVTKYQIVARRVVWSAWVPR